MRFPRPDRLAPVWLGFAWLGFRLGSYLRRRAEQPPATSPPPQRAPGPRRGGLAVLATLVAAVIGYTAWTWQQDNQRRRWAEGLTGGHADRGSAIMVRNGCGGCHDIPGVAGAHGTVGPPLRDIAGRVYIAGMLGNSPDNLVRWIRSAREVNPKTAMPSTLISEQDARDVAAYLYSLPPR